VNLEHNRGSEAAGWIKDLFIQESDGETKLMAKVEWTEMGQDKITKRLFKFVSAEFADKFPHHETGKPTKNVFMGLALTNTPALKNQTPVSLSEDATRLIHEWSMFTKLIAAMKKRKFLSAEDKKLIKKLSSELSKEERAEFATELKALADKPEKPEGEPEEEPADDEEDEEEEENEEEEEDEDEKVGDHGKDEVDVEEEEGYKEKKPATKMSESKKVLMSRLSEADNRIKKLETEQLRTQLSETATKDFMLSAKNVIGFAGQGTKDKVVSFLLSLKKEQRDAFKELMATVKSVSLSEEGKSVSANEYEPEGKDLEEEVTNRAKQLMSEKKAEDMGAALVMALGEIRTKNSQK